MPEPVVLRRDDVTVTIHPEAGGRLGQIDVGGRELLKNFEERGNAWGYWGSYVLLPWSNRIVGGRFSWRGQTFEMPELHDDGTALHGLVHSTPWTVESSDDTRAHLTTRIDRAPWTLRAEQRFSVTDDGLVHEVALTNDGDDDSPVGIGIHPWFRAGLVQAPVDLIWPSENVIPVGPPRPVAPDEDLRQPTVPKVMDECFTGVTGTSARIGDVTLSWDGPVTQIVVYTGEPGWVALEPVTNAVDGFNLLDRGLDGHGVIVLAPGESTAVRYTFTW